MKYRITLFVLLSALVSCSAGLYTTSGALATVSPARPAMTCGASCGGGSGNFPPCSWSYRGWHFQDAYGQWWTCENQVYGWGWVPGYWNY